MIDTKTLALIETARSTRPTPELVRRMIRMIDLTSLEADDTAEKIDRLCRDAATPAGPVAAVCISPAFVARAKDALTGMDIKIATVVDFPEGLGTPEDVMGETERALQGGADEIDLVFPYRRFLADTPPPASKNIRAVREIGGYDIRLKVILEAGAYPDFELLGRAAEIAIQGGADFLKTSTGKHPVGVTLESAAIILTVIAESGLPVGFKVSGGIREVEQAAAYLALAESILGEGWATPDTFRIGASALLPKLLAALNLESGR